LPKSFWGEAVLTASNIRNCCPSKVIQGKIPIEVWSKKAFTKDMAKEMKVFGCRAWNLDLNVKNKLDSRAVECIYLGSASDAKGYRLYSVNEKKIRISRDTRFEDSTFPYKTTIPKTVIETERKTPIYVYDSDCTDTEDYVDEDYANPNIVGNDINVDNPNELNVKEEVGDVPQVNVQPRRSVRTIKQRVVCECCAKINCVEITLTEPKSVGEALSRSDRDQWIGAMKTEIENLKKNQTWKVVRKLENVNVIGSRWVFSLKKKDEDTFKYKARLVAQGFHQVYGIDFWDSYSPVMR
jgi:histone deacetylase 1/2